MTLIVLVIAQQGTDPPTPAFERAARRALGRDANLQIERVSTDPPDEESVARGANADGVVELTWDPGAAKARIHCYLRRDSRWIDREISFGTGTASPEREAAERGRLLGFAVATMFAEEQPDATPAATDAVEEPAPKPKTKPKPKPKSSATTEPLSRPSSRTAPPAAEGERATTDDSATTPSASSRATMSVEFAGIASAGLDGDAGGLGATAGLRRVLAGPLWGRIFVAGRTGKIARAQASTLTAMVGAGLAFSFLPLRSRFDLGLRLDGFASYFEATHYSADDPEPGTQNRWLVGADLLAEVGVRVGGGTGLFLATGLEAASGRTDVYTHGTRVAVVPPFRGIAELGFRTRF